MQDMPLIQIYIYIFISTENQIMNTNETTIRPTILQFSFEEVSY